MKSRRTFIGSVIGVTTLVAGCSSNSGNTTDTQTPNVETLETTDTSETEEGPDSPNDEVTKSQGVETTTPEPTIDFNAILDDITKCGMTCRDIEYTLQNRGELSANQVTVSVSVHTDGEQVYNETHSVGDIQPQTQKTGITHQIDVGLNGGNKIKNNDGQITLTLVPESTDGVSKEFTFERTLDV